MLAYGTNCALTGRDVPFFDVNRHSMHGGFGSDKLLFFCLLGSEGLRTRLSASPNLSVSSAHLGNRATPLEDELRSMAGRLLSMIYDQTRRGATMTA